MYVHAYTPPRSERCPDALLLFMRAAKHALLLLMVLLCAQPAGTSKDALFCAVWLDAACKDTLRAGLASCEAFGPGGRCWSCCRRGCGCRGGGRG